MRMLDEDGLREKGIRYSRAQRNRLIKAGTFPRPVKGIAGSRNAWVESEIDEYIQKRIAARDAGQDAA